MTLDEKNKILKLIDEIRERDLKEKFQKIFGNDIDFESVKKDDMSIKLIIQTIELICFNLENGLENFWFSLPLKIETNIENIGTCSLQSDLKILIEKIDNLKKETDITLYIKRLSTYCLKNNLWNTNEHFTKQTLLIEKTLMAVKDFNNSYSGKIKKINELIENLNKEKNLLKEFKENKINELNEITNKLETIKIYTQEITDSYLTYKEYKGQIDSGLKNIQDYLFNKETDFSNVTERFNKLFNDMNSQQMTMEANFTKILEQLSEINDYKTKIDERNNLLDEQKQRLKELIPSAIGSNLNNTFELRRKQLSFYAKLWGFGIIISIICFTILVIYLVSSNYIKLDEPSSYYNLLKTLPLLFSLYFCIAQFNKERNLEEEYAFKSSVALSTVAYSDIIEENKSEKNNIINKSIDEVFKSPVYHKYKKESEKEINNIFDFVKDLLDKVINIKK